MMMKYVLGVTPRTAGLQSHSDEEEEDMDGMCQEDIPEDAYGAAILAVVRDVPMLSGGAGAKEQQLAFWNCFFAMGVLAMNLFLQCSMLGYISAYVVAEDVRQLQVLYRDFKHEMYTWDGKFLQDKWPLYQNRKSLCQITMWNRPFYYSILICWNLNMLLEIRRCEEFIRSILRVPIVEDPTEMVRTVGDKEYCVGFTRWARVAVLACSALPRLFIALLLLWMGCEWLSATSKFEDLVMNTVAMGFIVNIDDLLFEGLIPQQQKDDVEGINFILPEDEFETTATPVQQVRAAYRKSLMYLLACGIFIVSYAEWIQDVVPPEVHSIADMCRLLLTQDFQPSCVGQTWLLQGKPASTECFPFPQAAGSGGVGSVAAVAPMDPLPEHLLGV